MRLVTEGNLLYAISQVGSATIKEFYGFVVDPPEPPQQPDRFSQLEADNAMLLLAVAEGDARQVETEQTLADFIFTVVSGGV